MIFISLPFGLIAFHLLLFMIIKRREFWKGCTNNRRRRRLNSDLYSFETSLKNMETSHSTSIARKDQPFISTLFEIQAAGCRMLLSWKITVNSAVSLRMRPNPLQQHTTIDQHENPLQFTLPLSRSYTLKVR